MLARRRCPLALMLDIAGGAPAQSLAVREATGGREMVQCPICKSAAEEIDRGLFDSTGFDCKQHGRFRVADTVIRLMQSIKWKRRAWENALMLAKGAAAPGALPLIKSDYL